MIFNRLTLGAAALALSVSWAGAGVHAEDDPVVATVNGVKVHRSMLAEAQQLLPPQYQKIPLAQIYPALVDSVIDMKLAAADAREKKLHQDPEFKKLMRRIEDQMLQRSSLQKIMSEGITEDAVRARYDKMVAGKSGAEEVHARHILVKTEDEAKAIIKDLKGGADFETLAKEKSTGPSGPNGGDLGFFAKGQMVPAFEKAAFGMDKGEVTDEAVKTQFGYHVIKVEAKRKSEAPSFEKMEQQLRTELSQEKATTFVASLRKGAKIERFDLEGKPLEKPKAK
jgi:peptidyl-prolyl cis-trans isomerase C